MNGMTVGLDLAVLATSGAMALYCGQLARRLSALRRAGGQTPKAIEALTEAIERSERSAVEVAGAAERATEQMRAAFVQLDRQRQEAEDLSGLLDGQAALAERRVREAQVAAETAMRAVTQRAGIELEALGRAVELAAATNAMTPQARRAGGAYEERPATGAPPDATLPGAESAPVRQRASAEPNPFLRAVG